MMATQTLSSSQKSGAGLPSPTLTNPDMILPNGHAAHHRTASLSSLPEHEIPPSPPQLRLRAAPKSSQAREHRRQRLSREILRDSDAQVGADKAHRRLSAKASAPALKTQDSFEMAKKRLSVERKWSDGSAESINSDVLAQIKWPPARSADHANGDDLQEDEYDDQKSSMEDEAGESQNEIEDDPYSTMSRRAEIILANAKKRLNLMEGNLRGARTSLKSPIPYSFSPVLANGASAHDGRVHSSLGFSPAQNHGGPIRASSALQNGSPGHSRNFSESHAPARSLSLSTRSRGNSQPFATSRNSAAPSFLQTRSLRGTRSSEVLGDNKGHHHHPLRKTSLEWSSPTSLDPLPEDESGSRGNGTGNPSEQGFIHSPSTTNDLRNQMHLLKGRISSLRERTIEDNRRRRSMQSTRIPSPFTDAEAWYTGAETYKGQSVNTEAGVGYSPTEQVHGNGPGNSLDQLIALDPSLEEGSTPDPRYSNPYSSLPIDPRLGGVPQSAQAQVSVEEKELDSGVMTPRDEFDGRPRSTTAGSMYEDAQERNVDTGGQSTPTPEDGNFKSSYFDDNNEDAEEPQTATRMTFSEGQGEDKHREQGRMHSDRHEDRADAFDYENFFLHSSMGSMSRGRRSSVSSNESVETTKGPAAEMQSEPQSSGGAPETPQALRDIESRMQHKRRESASSVSTFATFATATEGNNTPADEKEEDDVLPAMTSDLQISQNNLNTYDHLPIPLPATQGRSDSVVGIQMRDGGQRTSPVVSNPSQGQADLALEASTRNRSTSGSLPISGSAKPRSGSGSKPWFSPVVTPVVNSLLTSTRPAIKLDKRDQTNVRILIESLREVCLRLEEGGGDEDETREWRRRIEEARMVLDGRSRPRI
ncbi:MAG: hypothetical protein M1821_007770 [Bathelium mastoideum]|nr:MAG: hypothetical protein M1821_007770 [Bathelium mastoideum]